MNLLEVTYNEQKVFPRRKNLLSIKYIIKILKVINIRIISIKTDLKTFLFVGVCINRELFFIFDFFFTKGCNFCSNFI